MGLISIPIVVLYLLRQKRPDLQVSSTLLWAKALADMRASTPFQKLRRNLLLLLQLLILAALVFALMRPVIQGAAGRNRAGVIVIDATASMQATDGRPNGQTRLERAKEEARKLVDTMRPGDRYMLIGDGGGMVQSRSGFSTSKSEIQNLIEQIKPSDTPSDLSESLLLAATSLRAMGGDSKSPTNGNPNAIPAAFTTESVVAGKVWLFSDGAGVRVPDVMGTAEGSQLLKFIKIGDSDASVGVTRLSITPVPKEKRTYQVFVGLTNAAAVERKVAVLLAYGKPDDLLPGQSKFVTLPPHSQGGTVFDHVVSDPGKLFVRVDPEGDVFPLDNIAFGLLEPPRKIRVSLITKGSAVLENFLRSASKIMDVEGMIVDPDKYTPDLPADLIIFDGFAPAKEQLPKADMLFVRPPTSAGGFSVSAELENPPVLNWRREDPALRYVNLSELRISHSLMLERDPEAVELVWSPEAPLISYKDYGSQRRYFVSFNVQLESNWWKQSSLLVFLQNIVEQTRTRHFIGLPQLLASGQSAKLWDLADKATIETPDGDTLELTTKAGTADFAGTDRLGFYEVQSKGARSTFAVNLLSPTESAVAPLSLQTPSGGNVEETDSVARVNKEIWHWLAIAGIAVLLIEWFVYHRRIA